MHPRYEQAQAWSAKVIGAAIEVHREMGPGLFESIYEGCLRREFELQSIPNEEQRQVPVEYKGWKVTEPLRFDFLVDGCLVVEAKAVEAILPVHKAQLLTYMKLLDAPLGLLINFHEAVLKDGIVRMILKGADR
jgi:GxxExxY protein